MSTQPPGEPEVGYSPEGFYICTSCRSCIRHGQLRFTKDSSIGNKGWSHFWCLLETKPRTRDKMVLLGSRYDWQGLYRIDPTRCRGYSNLHEVDKRLFEQSLHEIDVATVKQRKKEEAEMMLSTTHQAYVPPRNGSHDLPEHVETNQNFTPNHSHTTTQSNLQSNTTIFQNGSSIIPRSTQTMVTQVPRSASSFVSNGDHSASKDADHFNINSYDWMRDPLPIHSPSPGNRLPAHNTASHAVNGRQDISLSSQPHNLTNNGAMHAEASTAIAAVKSEGVTTEQNSNYALPSPHFRSTNGVKEERRPSVSFALPDAQGLPKSAATMRTQTNGTSSSPAHPPSSVERRTTNHLNISPRNDSPSTENGDNSQVSTRYGYCVKVMKNKAARCAVCTPPGYVGHPRADEPGRCMPGQLVFGAWQRTAWKYRHVGCLTTEYLAYVRTEWKKMGKGIRIQDFVDDFDQISKEDQVKLFHSISKKENKFESTPALHILPSPSSSKREVPEDTSASPAAKRLKVEARSLTLSPLQPVSPRARPLKTIVTPLANAVPGSAERFAHDTSLIGDDEESIWLLRWKPGVVSTTSTNGESSRESVLCSLNKVTNTWTRHPTLKQKIGKWANLKSPAYTHEQSIPFLRKAFLNIFTSSGGRSYMLLYGERTQDKFDWIYVDLSSGIWWKQNPDKDIPPRHPKGYAVFNDEQLITWSGGIAHATSTDSHKGGLARFDVPSQTWLDHDVPLTPEFEDHLSSTAPRASRFDVQSNFLGILQNHLFVLPYNSRPSEGVCFDKLLYRALPIDNDKEPLSHLQSQRLIHTNQGTVPTAMTRAALHVLNVSTLIVIGTSNAPSASSPVGTRSSNKEPTREVLRIWQCLLSHPIDALARTADLSISGTWKEIRYAEYLPETISPDDIHHGFIHAGNISLLGYSIALGGSDTAEADKLTNVRVDIELLDIV